MSAGRADPLAEVVGLVRPRAVLGKEVVGTGRWGVRFAANDAVDFGIVTAGRCHYVGPGGPLELGVGDFLLLCAPPDFRFGDCAATPAVDGDAAYAVTRLARFGDTTAADACRLLIGHFRLDRDDAEFVTGLLPASVVVRADARSGRLRRLLRLLAEEAAADRSGRELVLVRLVEVVLVEALRGPDDRTAATGTVPRGLVRGLADPVAGPALVALHADVARPWTVGRLAAAVGASRSVLAERFTRTVGTAPMTYLLHWRLALAKQALIRGDGLTEIAHTVGFASASGFSAAFLRVVGMRPGHYAQQQHRMSPDG